MPRPPSPARSALLAPGAAVTRAGRWPGSLSGGLREGLLGAPWWMFLLVALTLASMSLSVLVIRSASGHQRTLLLLADTTALTHQLEALDWRAISGEPLDASFWLDLDRCVRLARQREAELRRAAARENRLIPVSWLPLRPTLPPGVTLPAAAVTLGEYREATTQELALIRQGDRQAARELDAARVDPLSERLGVMISERLGVMISALRVRQTWDARVSLQLAALLGILTLLISLVTVTLLSARLRRSLQRARTLEREGQAQREREERDSLTGLWNRGGLARQYVHWAGLGPLSVVVLDLNRLKVINDLGGHAAGDAHLRRVALALLEVTEPLGLVARWGGDEFVMLLPALDAGQAAGVAGRALALLETPGEPLPPFAFGVSAVQGVSSLERSLALADAAMYEHKEGQRRDAEQRGGGRLGPSVEEFTSRLEQLETPQDVLGEGLMLARQVLDFHASVYLERTGEDFVLRELSGDLPPSAARALTERAYRAGTGLTGQVIADSAAHWSNDYPDHPGALDAWVQAGLKSTLLVPVRYGGRVMGVLGLLQFGSWRVVTPQARRLTEAVASRLGHTFERLQAVETVRSALQGGLLALGVALEERDLETAGHTARVVDLSAQLGRQLGLHDAKLDALRQGASLHDIGKLVIPDAILLKPGPLDEQEWQVMRHHAERGYEIAHRLSGLMPATLDVIRSHHERWDGRGYPDGLAGEAIPLAARIFAVCDVYDALTHVRPYKEAWSHAAAIAEIRAQSGTQFDPQVVEQFVALIEGSRHPDAARPTPDLPGTGHP
ncbi:diguanylate cyclase [Deinococcus aquaticus]|uniref:Diguanylate cyclase n=1 Tax=Deinococcus aquaticus TaxID=328692 RepID=A0ABY7V3D9_9DEIO|nr:HD domain-containing phosphohydrolase [Deinococcus aquaticus]WDA59702.1 diguanylate cyclase [Deinococcus aquaticus]